MDENIRAICQIKLDDIYHMLKTNSDELNMEILSVLKNFSSSKDFLATLLIKV